MCVWYRRRGNKKCAFFCSNHGQIHDIVQYDMCCISETPTSCLCSRCDKQISRHDVVGPTPLETSSDGVMAFDLRVNLERRGLWVAGGVVSACIYIRNRSWGCVHLHLAFELPAVSFLLTDFFAPKLFNRRCSLTYRWYTYIRVYFNALSISTGVIPWGCVVYVFKL